MTHHAPDTHDPLDERARRAGAAVRHATEELTVTADALHAHRRAQTTRRGVLASGAALAAAAALAVVLTRPDATLVAPASPPAPEPDPAPTSVLVEPAALGGTGVTLTLPPMWQVEDDTAEVSTYALRVDGETVATASVFVPGRDPGDFQRTPGLVDVESTSTTTSVGPAGLVFYEVDAPMTSPLCAGAADEPCGIPDVEPGRRYVAAFLGDGTTDWVVHGIQGETSYSFYNAVPALVQGFSDD